LIEPSSREAAALDSARRALDMLSYDLARYDLTSWRCRDAARAYLAAGFPVERIAPYLERGFQRGLHDRVHSYEALPDEYVGNNADLIADAYLAGGDVAKRLETLAQVLDAVVKQKGSTLAHRVQHALALWGASRANDARARALLAPVKSASVNVRASLDTAYPKARFVLAVVEDDAAEATDWLATYDALLPTEPGAAYRRVHLITVVFWLIARDRYHMTLPTDRLPGLPDSLRCAARDTADEATGRGRP
jgi:hypothetical protein